MKRHVHSLSGVLMIMVSLGCEEKPQWNVGSGLSRETYLCDVVRYPEYMLLVTPRSIGKPVKKLLSTWPDNPMWSTPVEWNVDQVLLRAPTPGKSLPPIGQVVTVFFAGPFSELKTQRTISVHEMDGEWWIPSQGKDQFTLASTGWRRESAEYSWPTETFPDVPTLERAVDTAAANPDCQRVEWVTATRLSEEARLAQARNPSPLPTQASDAGP